MKYSAWRFITTIVLLPLISNAQVPQNGLKSFWNFSGNANDQGAAGRNGTVNGATLTTDRYGNPNSAYYFDGINDYIDIGDAGLPSGDSAYSLSVWIYPEINTNFGFGTILSYGKNNNTNTDNGKSNSFWISSSADSLININNDWRNRADTTKVDSTGWFNNWHHIVIVKPAGDTIGTFFIDGVLRNPQRFIPPNRPTSLRNIQLAGNGFIGRNFFHSQSQYLYHFKGKIDDFGIWNRKLTAQEITFLDTCNRTVSVANGIDTIYFSKGQNLTISSSVFGGSISKYDWLANAAGIGWSGIKNNSTYSVINDSLIILGSSFANHNQWIKLRVNGCNNASDSVLLRISDTCVFTTNDTINVFDTTFVTVIDTTSILDTTFVTVTDTITITDTTFISVSDTLIIDFTGLGQSGSLSTNVKVYPNPASQLLLVDIDNFALLNNYTLSVYNSSGTLMTNLAITSNQVSIDISPYPPGTYSLSIINSSGSPIISRNLVVIR